jgi:predicted AAA+ superfamily ATPase
MVARLITEKIIRSKKSILLLGPRQTGKSTLLNAMRPDLVVDLSLESEFLRSWPALVEFEHF